MQPKSIFPTILLSAAGALALALSSGSAFAQGPAPSNNGPSYDSNNMETVEVYAYGRRTKPSLGGKVVHASFEAPVTSHDLDLTTASGARAFRARVTSKAHQLCRNLDIRHPVSANEDSGPVSESSCYKKAVTRGLKDAERAIAHARRSAPQAQ